MEEISDMAALFATKVKSDWSARNVSYRAFAK
jgi:hypothetical protein